MSNTNVVDLLTLMDFLENLNTKNMMIKTMYILMFTSKSTTMFCTSLIKDTNIIKRIRELYQPFVITAYDRVKEFYQLETLCIPQLCIIFDISISKLLMDKTQIDVLGTHLPLALKYFSEALRCASYNVVFDWIDNSFDLIIYLLKEICTHDNVDVYKHAITHCWKNLAFADDDFTHKMKQNIVNEYNFDGNLYSERGNREELKPLFTIDEHCLIFGSKNIALYVYENITNKSLFLTKLIKMRYYMTIQYLYDNCGIDTKEQFVIYMREAIDCMFGMDYGNIYNYLKYDSTLGDDSNNKSDFFTSTVLDYVNGNIFECKTGSFKSNISIEKQIEICMYCGLNDHFKELVENNPNVMNHITCANLIIKSLMRNNMFCVNIITEIVKNTDIKLTFGKEHLDIFCSENNQMIVQEHEQIISNIKTLLDNGIFDEGFIFDIMLELSPQNDNFVVVGIFNSQYAKCIRDGFNVQNNANFLKKAIEKSNTGMIYLIAKDNPYIFIENYDFLRGAIVSGDMQHINYMYKICSTTDMIGNMYEVELNLNNNIFPNNDNDFIEEVD